jgi:hypothetical protein
MKKIVLTFALLGMLGLSAVTFAQTSTPKVTDRQINQEARIQEGKNNGELTRREKRRLQMQQAKIQRDKKVAKADGVVTPEERRQLTREQRRASRNIYRQKHNNEIK